MTKLKILYQKASLIILRNSFRNDTFSYSYFYDFWISSDVNNNMLPQYKILKNIGQGHYGDIYLVEKVYPHLLPSE